MTLTPLITEAIARRVARWRAQGYTFETIGLRLGISTKTAQRAVYGRAREVNYHDKQMERLADIPSVPADCTKEGKETPPEVAASITAAMEAIKAKWTEKEWDSRRVGGGYVPVEIQRAVTGGGRVIRTAIK